MSIIEIMSIKVKVHLIRTTPGSVDKNESPPPIEDSIFENDENIDKHAFIKQRNQPVTHPHDTNTGNQNDCCRSGTPTIVKL